MGPLAISICIDFYNSFCKVKIISLNNIGFPIRHVSVQICHVNKVIVLLLGYYYITDGAELRKRNMVKET